VEDIKGKIKVVSFDWNGTLVNFNDFDKQFWDKLIPELYAKKYNLSFEEAQEKVLRKYNRNGSHKAEWYCPSFWFKKFEFKEDLNEELKKPLKVIEIYPETKEVLKSLKGKYKLICLTRSAKEIVELSLSLLGILDYFDEIFSTVSDFDCPNKSKDTYLKICNKMKVKPDEVLHVGDNYERDYLEPKKAGLNVVFLDRTGEMKDSVKDLREVETFLN